MVEYYLMEKEKEKHESLNSVCLVSSLQAGRGREGCFLSTLWALLALAEHHLHTTAHLFIATVYPSSDASTRIMNHAMLKSSQKGLLMIKMHSLHANGLHSHLWDVVIESLTSWMYS